MPEYEHDEKSTKWCRLLVKRHPEFKHIKPEDIVVVRDVSSQNSHFYAATRLVPKQFWPLVNFRILIQTNDCNYAPLPKNAKILVMHHELRHVGVNSKGGYKMVRHDVEDFREYLEKYGIGWATRKDLPNILEKEEIKKEKK